MRCDYGMVSSRGLLAVALQWEQSLLHKPSLHSAFLELYFSHSTARLSSRCLRLHCQRAHSSSFACSSSSPTSDAWETTVLLKLERWESVALNSGMANLPFSDSASDPGSSVLADKLYRLYCLP